MKKFFDRFALDVIAACAFGVQCDSLKDPESEFVKIAGSFNDVSRLNRIINFFVILLVPQIANFLPLSFFNKQVSVGEI
jgi:cytochrome P450 family 9